MHVTPGRNTDHFYLLAGNSKVDLLVRASVAKAQAGGAVAAPPKVAPPAATAPAKPAEPVALEDWWLARDAQGHIGWLLASRVDVEVPDAIAEYGEGQRFIGAWKIATVNDPGSDFPDHEAPEYLALMSPPKAGLPFDFDQVRVFTWSKVHHRYETGFRLHPIQGFLPVKIFTAQTSTGTVPAFSFEIAASDDVTTDPATGAVRPASSRTIQYEMIDTQVKRIGPDMAPIPVKHEPGEARKPGAAAKKPTAAAKKKR
jgi:hypothetical protein